jgi:hypothetical protein
VKTTLVLLGAAALLSTAGGAAARESGITAPHFNASVVGSTKTPFAGMRWRYRIRAVNSAGRPVKASALVRVFVAGRVLDTIGMFGFKGTLRGTYRWSTTLRGFRAVLQAKVTGPGGVRTVSYPVRIRSYSGTPHFRAALGGGTRTPRPALRWPYVVRAKTVLGNPVSGTVIVRVLVRGRVVDTIGWFGFKGTLRRTYHWSPTLKGARAVLQASVVGPGGTRTVGYAVRVS